MTANRRHDENERYIKPRDVHLAYDAGVVGFNSHGNERVRARRLIVVAKLCMHIL
jgi:hypothetical protein